MAPARVRIASRSVVLPLWNGPTSATQRGPVVRAPSLPFNAINASRRGPRHDRRGPLWTIVSGVAGAGQEATSRPNSLRVMQLKRADAASGIEPGLALHRERLQRHPVVRAADQSIGADPAGDSRLRGRADISAGQHAGIAIGPGEHA